MERDQDENEQKTKRDKGRNGTEIGEGQVTERGKGRRGTRERKGQR